MLDTITSSILQGAAYFVVAMLILGVVMILCAIVEQFFRLLGFLFCTLFSIEVERPTEVGHVVVGLFIVLISLVGFSACYQFLY